MNSFKINHSTVVTNQYVKKDLMAEAGGGGRSVVVLRGFILDRLIYDSNQRAKFCRKQRQPPPHLNFKSKSSESVKSLFLSYGLTQILTFSL